MLREDIFTKWLYCDQKTKNGKYRHKLIKENKKTKKAKDKLKKIIQNSHEDARQRIRDVSGYSLDPLQNSEIKDPANGYPDFLPMKTLQGYFGEVFAGIIAENFSPMNDDKWEVPAFLFRFHTIAFQYLELYQQDGKKPPDLPGRTGDDCLAFRRDESGNIIKSLLCEAKCTSSHSSKMISDAHQKLDQHDNLKPVDLIQLIELLLCYNDSDSRNWVESLRQLHFKDLPEIYERCNLISYVCGQSPKRKKAWMPQNAPHQNYKSKQKLEAVEIHLKDVDNLVRFVYEKDDSDAK